MNLIIKYLYIYNFFYYLPETSTFQFIIVFDITLHHLFIYNNNNYIYEHSNNIIFLICKSNLVFLKEESVNSYNFKLILSLNVVSL